MQLTITRHQGPAATFALAPEGVTVLRYALEELHSVAFLLEGLDGPTAPQMWIGDTPADMAQPPRVFPQDYQSPSGVYRAEWPTRQYFERYAGRCLVRIEVPGAPPRQLAAFELVVQPSKLTAQGYEALLQDLQDRERGLLLDVYGKTSLGEAERERPAPEELRPEEFLQRIRKLLAIVEREMAEIRRRPQEGVRAEMGSRPFRPGQSLHSRELDGLSRSARGLMPAGNADPYALRAGGRRISIERAPRLEAVPDPNIYEHRAIRWFVQRLSQALNHLRAAAQTEHLHRTENRAWKDIAIDGRESWWEQEDRPRLAQLEARMALCEHLLSRCLRLLRRHPSLQNLTPFTPPLRLTPAFWRRPPYRRLYEQMQQFNRVGSDFRFLEAGEHLRAQDLAKLFEYWCALRLLDELRARFHVREDAGSIFQQDHFVVTLRPDSDAWFKSEDGRYLRFRYEAAYMVRAAAKGEYGRLNGYQGRYLPDLAVEVFGRRGDRMPELIYIFECKYSRHGAGGPQPAHIEKAYDYLNGIGRFDRRIPLVRHSWILYAGEAGDELHVAEPEDFLTARSGQDGCSVGGAPLLPGNIDDPFPLLLDRLFALEGIRSRRRSKTDAEPGRVL